MDQQLQVFITVAEMQNFSRAAEALHMTQPAVSQYIRTFEDNIGMRLLDRTNKYVRLNKAGEIVYHHAKEIVGLYSRMESLLDDLTNKVSGTLSIGASYTFGEYVLPHIIAKMKAVYPDVQPTVTIGNTEKIAELVGKHQLDIGIIEGSLREKKQLQIAEFAEDQMVIVAANSHPLVKKENVMIKDLEEQTWIFREEGSGTREAAEILFKQFEIHPNQVMTFSSTQPIKEAVEAGMGITLLSKLTIRKEIQHGDLSIIVVNGLPYTRQFSMVTSSPFQTKALQKFVELLLKV